jgi:hypothetical protein
LLRSGAILRLSDAVGDLLRNLLGLTLSQDAVLLGQINLRQVLDRRNIVLLFI